MSDFRKGVYRHFKGNLYELVDTAIHSETRSPVIVYRALYGDRGLFVRPAEMWSERVQRDGYDGPRFAWVAETEEEARQLEGKQ